MIRSPVALRAFVAATVLSAAAAHAQVDPASRSPWTDSDLQGLALRSIGPAFMSGRIADIAIHPRDENLWYVAAGSGGVWKTCNAGTTWKPVFDEQPVYSIGCITIDPHDPATLWVGTGEDVGGRHVGFGDGVYMSPDGGDTWRNVGLGSSEHITKIIVHPGDPNTLWVAAQGPLWNTGGERGIYKSTDRGKTWRRTIGDDGVGVGSLALDPRNPNRLYTATWERHRTVAAYMGGGSGSAIHRSDDGGETWTKLQKGLPDTIMGKIGLAVSPQNPDVVYAAIELERRKGGIWRSTDGGSTWEKRSDTVSGGTGPHYYQELYASPHAFDRLYLADVRMRVSDDGGKTFRRMKEKAKHSDNHALAFRASDPDYLLVGTDGGLYESFDLAEHWRYFANLPLTQFYKIAVDDAAPFYNIYGGTQDNSTQCGPVRTDRLLGIRNADWEVVLNWDGHQPATEPGNPDIAYGERQEGHLARLDRRTGEVVSIQPQPREGEPYERFNWDAPILVSPHSSTRLFFASQRVWRSDDRGDSWRPISDDLTRHEERFSLDILGGPQGWDAPWDVYAMSNYNTITSLAESPLQEDLLYAGTDDGVLQVSENGGESWRKIDASSIDGLPERAFVNDVRADLHDANTVYVALDNHKEGDYTPYLFASTDRGRTWQSIRGNLPDRSLIWRIAQDHVDPNLLFVGTEFGVYVSTDRGSHWMKLKGGIPTIPVRDLTIHRRDSDLVCGTFGRGLYVFDDITVFRHLGTSKPGTAATLYPPRDAWWYIERPSLGFSPGTGSQGEGYFTAPNPPFGAVFTYRLAEDLTTASEARSSSEKRAREGDTPQNPFPGWDTLDAEQRQPAPKVWLTIRNESGDVVRTLNGPLKAGFHRVAWDLRSPAPAAVQLDEPSREEWDSPPRGLLVAPGQYTVELAIESEGTVSIIGERLAFGVRPLRDGALRGPSPAAAAEYWRTYEDTVRDYSALKIAADKAAKRSERLEAVLARTPVSPTHELHGQYRALRQEVADLTAALDGSPSKREVGEKSNPTIATRLSAIELGVSSATYGPTPLLREQLDIARQATTAARVRLERLQSALSKLAVAMRNAGGPPLEGF